MDPSKPRYGFILGVSQAKSLASIVAENAPRKGRSGEREDGSDMGKMDIFGG